MEKENKSFIGYISFVICSAAVGFIMIFAILKFLPWFAKFSLSQTKVIIISLICTSIYVGLCFVLRNILENIFLSEVFLYLFFGVLTTVINVGVFNILDITLKNSISNNNLVVTISNTIAFIIAVLFAYITNKLFVFKSFSFMPSILFSEMGKFFGARVITYAIETLGILAMINFMKQSELIAKIVVSTICIILNYIASKFIIFKESSNK